ncbi:MAG: sodium:calcium antiporter [Steroidobacteraceae bacterium]
MGETWLTFMLCTAVIGTAGYQLSRFGDVIAERTGLGRTLVGVIMMATVTSLPELVTGIGAVTVADVPNIAVGDALGSCIFNLLILLFLELAYPRASIYTLAAQSHILSAGFGIILIGIVALSVLVGDQLPTLGHVGLYTPVILAGYLLAMRIVTQYELREARLQPEPEALRHPDLSLRQAVLGYVVAALFVVAAGLWLPFIGADLARVMGWNNSFVGSLFVAFATSLPELAVALSALRLGALDMAMGNLLGSNLFDMAIIAIDDLAYLEGPLLHGISKAHAGTAISALVMSGAVIAALFYRPAQRTFRLFGWTGLFLLVIYALNAYVLFLVGQ